MTVWFVMALGAAAVDWWAVTAGRRAIESVAKPLVMALLIGAALTIGAAPAWAAPWIVGGLALGLVGDISLLPHVDRFIAGLAAFLVGHVLYLVGLFAMADLDRGVNWGLGWALAWLIAGALALDLIIRRMAIPILSGVRGSKLRLPVTIYMGAVTMLVIVGFATFRWPIAIGAVLFAVSDGLLGANRFVKPAPQRRVFIHILYHLGQAGLVVGLHPAFA